MEDRKMFRNWEEFISSDLEYYVKMEFLRKSLPFRYNMQESRQE